MIAKEDFVRLALRSPQSLPSLTLRDWDLLVRQARNAGVLGSIHALLEKADLLSQIPRAPRAHLESDRTVALSEDRTIRWETYCIKRALGGVNTDIVLLKGAAYLLSGFPIADGRLQSD